MLTAVIASTTAKPSMIFPRNRKVGSLNDIDCGQTRFNPTSKLPSSFGKPAESETPAPEADAES
jgi:hypothetical protein